MNKRSEKKKKARKKDLRLFLKSWRMKEGNEVERKNEDIKQRIKINTRMKEKKRKEMWKKRLKILKKSNNNFINKRQYKRNKYEITNKDMVNK